MTDSNSLFDFYDCNSSSNSFLKFEVSTPLFDLSPSSAVASPALETEPVASHSDNSITDSKMDSSHNNPLLTTASMPIPARNVSSNTMSNNNNRTMTDFSDVIFELENSKSPLSAIHEHPKQNQSIPMLINYSDNNTFGFQPSSSFSNCNTLIWDEMNPMMNVTIENSSGGADHNDRSGTFHMDEDEIFQVDKSDLIQGPTLAELNGDNLYVDLLNIEDILAADQQYIQQQSHNIQNNQFTQLTAVNFHNLQNAINDAALSEQLSPNQYHAITIPQTPHNTPIPSFQSSGGHIIFCDDPSAGSSPYDIYSAPNVLSIATNLRGATNAAFSPGSHSSTSTSSIILNSSLSPPPAPAPQTIVTASRVRASRTNSARSSGLVQHNPKYSTLHTLLMKKDPTNAEKALMSKIQHATASPPSQLMSQTSAVSPSGLPTRRLNMQGGGIISRLSSSAPTHLGLEHIWQRREPRPHLLSTGSLAEGQGSTSSLNGEVISPEQIDYSPDDEFSDDEDSEHYEDFSSDSDIEDNKDHFRSMSASDNNNNKNFTSKKSRYFWQYNVQAKGPKGQRLVIKTQAEDPHKLNEVTDPVFSPNCSIRGIKSVQIKHSGKARKGDGNDLTPNAKKLNAIGKELDKLGRVINDMTPVSELPFNVRPKTRKEKNKLASRACRLKKKAQHEANKIKLFGLENEHKRLMSGIHQMKQLLALKCSSRKETQEEINQRMEQVVAKATTVKIADNSTEYVNRVLDRIKSGVPNGGLEDF